jgi:amino acid adenylation domain-containing protein
MLEAFLEAVDRDRCPSLRRVLASGEALSPVLAERFFDRLGHAELYNLYGPTEAAVDVTFWRCTPGAGSVPLGRPIDNTALRVLDRRLLAVPIGAAGELMIGGAPPARGYLGRPDLTAERFVPDPYGDPGARLYRTGDLARWTAGGLLEYLGRIDQQVKIRGVRVEPGEVEATLAAHPAIREAAVVVGAGPRLIAYVAAMDLEVDGTALRSFLSERLPAAMVPSTFVLLAGRDGLPRTPNGKLDRRALPAPPPISGETPYAAPRTPVEEIVAEAWSEALGIRPVGIDDDYFALGGDSIRTLRVQALARRRGLHLAFADLYRFRTVRELAATARPDHSVEPETEPLSLLTAAERAPLPPTVEDAFPLARVLAGLAFESALEDDYEVYVTSLHLRARVDPVALQRAADLLVSRHPMLRSSFDLGSVGRPLQLVHRQVRVAIRFVDLSSLPSSVAAREVEEFLGRERRRRFDWERPPLLRLAVHSLADGTFHLSASEPFLDGWSVATMLTELLRFQLELSAQGDGQRKPEAPPAGSFASFVALELAALHSEEARRFWAERLAGAAPARWPRWPLAPRDRRSPAISRLEVPIPTELSHALERSAREIGTPLKSLLLAAHLKVLAVQMGVDDVLAGVLGSGRPETLDGDRILGLFLQPVPLRLRLGAATWADLARRAFDAEREILPHRRYPSAELRQQHGGEPLFDAVFNYTHFHAYLGLTSLPEIQVLGGTATDQTYFDLTVQFNLDHAGGGLRLALDFRTAKWSRAQIRAIGELYRQALARLAEAPHSRHDAVPLLSPAERHQILQEWNDTDTVWGRQGDLPLHALVAEQAARTPHAVAVSSVEGSWTYAELLHHSAVVARWLRRVPLSLEQPVAVCSERSLDLVAGLLGSLLAGLPFLPLDATDPEDRLAAVLEAAASGPHSPVLLTRRRWQGQRPAALAGLARRGVRELFLDEAEADAPALQETPPAVDPGALAYVLHTSGSTGRPKGAMNSHQGVVNRLLWMQRTFSLTPEDRVLQKTPVSFDVSVWELFWPLITGARLVLAPPEAHLDPAEIVSLIVDEGVTVAHFVPSLLRLFLDEPAAVTCRSLRRVIASGEALGTHLADRFHAALPDTELHNLYGPTEAAIDVAAWACAPGATTVPIGRPVANTRLYIVDRTGLPVSAGAPGELWIGGVQVGRGYLGRPDLTAERFVPDPFSRQPGARAYRTGDLARHLPEGEIDFLGRVDHQVKLRGVRVELGEVEAALASHPGVAAAAAGVAPAPDGHPRLVAWWVAGPAGSPSEESLREHVSSRLPRSMVPAAFVKLSSLPHTPSGKLDRQRLPSPEAATESRIAELLAQVAALSDEQAQAVLSAGQKS